MFDRTFIALAIQTFNFLNRLHPTVKVQSFCSSFNGKFNLSSFDLPIQGSGSPGNASTWQLSVDDTSNGHKQKVTGFGATVTDSTVNVINQLPSSTLDELLRVLFTDDGANFSLLRHTIGSSDLSGDPAYTYDDNNGKEDISLNSFSLGNRGNAMAALLGQMKGINSAIKILGSPWSPPGWMKLDRKLTGSIANNSLDHTYADSWAQYYIKYIQAYQDAGVGIDAITIQNEPLNVKASMPTMHVSANESGQLIRNHLGPALQEAGLPTKIWAYDHNTDRPDYPRTVLDIADQYTDTVAWHCYAGYRKWTNLTAFHITHPSVTQYMTECWVSNDRAQTPWHQAADFTIGPLQNWASGSIAWAMGTNPSFGPHLSAPGGPCTTCLGIVVVDPQTQTYELTLSYYLLAQFSKFIPRNAIVLEGTGSAVPGMTTGGGIESVATRNPDGSRTIVLLNTVPDDVFVTVTFTGGEVWTGRVYENSVVTWVLP